MKAASHPSRARTTGVVATLGALVAGVATPRVATAQTASPKASTDNTVELNAVTPEGGQPGNTNARTTNISRLSGTVRDIPKVVNLVPEKVIKEQAVSTLEETLRNVPGSTLSTGEGRGGQKGDQFRIRGLTSRGDVYIDGLRDFGVYTRDTINTESVEVIKSPSRSDRAPSDVVG